ncbi:MAG: phosphodiester glycosidase family protein [Saprospiraceae bacterium]|nr:phosphodiester glycosidase family protein [Saprospiraceae bacterium]
MKLPLRSSVLIQDGEIHITNREEKNVCRISRCQTSSYCHGYTSDHHLIILSIKGRHPGIADGVSLMQEAQILKDLGCVEALNLDGGGSSCMLIHGERRSPLQMLHGAKTCTCCIL